jgi:DNA invertase Pin-like site-specific DNA recombinase
MTAKAASGVKVFSYVRFSSDEQKLGDSERRQVEAADAWVKRKGLTLTALKPDRGLSGYHGAHRKKGYLGLFLADVESGKVSPGSILLVENIDRLGREGPAEMLQEVIFKLWKRNITLQTVSPEETYPPGCAHDPKFVVLILYLQRAWDESDRKSKLARANWTEKQKRAQKKVVLTAYCPAWLKVTAWRDSGDRKVADKLEVIPEAAKAIQFIFDMKLKGVGFGVIAKRLNAEFSWRPPKRRSSNRTEGWRESYIAKIVANPAVAGIYQPYNKTKTGTRVKVGEPIPGFYPIVIKLQQFELLRRMLSVNTANGKRSHGGRTAKARNLFVSIAVCGYCGGPLAYADKGSLRGGQWLMCDTGRRGAGCARHTIRYEEVENLILRMCHDIKPEEVLPNPSEQVAKVAELRQRIAGKDVELEGSDTQIDNLIEHLANAKDADLLKRVEAKIVKLKERKAELEAGVIADRVELEKAEQGRRSFKEWQANLRTMFAALQTGDLELRLKLRAHLRTFLEKIVVYADGTETPLSIPKGMPKEYIPFLRNLQKRRATKEGRFIKLLYTTQPERETGLAPKGSLAFETGMPRRTLAGGWKMMGRAAELFKEWQRSA